MGLCFTLPLGLDPLAAGVLGLGYLWKHNFLPASVDAIVNRLSRAHHKAYGWDIIRLSTRTAEEMESDLVYVLCILGCANITDMRNVTLAIKNEKKLTDYSFTSRQLPSGSYLSQLSFDEFIPNSLSQYIQMDSDVQRWAGPFARELCKNTDSPYEMAQIIASYVRNSATYNTRTRRMPASQDDFARWFLEESDSGYCVHFATAATVLLQAADLPARYVTGYTAQKEFPAAAILSVHACALLIF